MAGPSTGNDIHHFLIAGQIWPYLGIYGTSDEIVTYKDNAILLKAAHPATQLLSIDKGSHLGFAGFGNYLAVFDNPDFFGCLVVESNLEAHPLKQSFVDQTHAFLYRTKSAR